MDIHLAITLGLAICLILTLVIDTSRMWFRRVCRYTFYENRIAEFFRNKFLQIVVPGVAGAYFLCLDVWGDDWDIIKNNKETHEFIFSGLIMLSLGILLIRGTADWYEGKSDKSYISFMEQFSILTSKLVTKKLERFKEQALSLKPSSNTFKQITNPKEQINLVLGEIENLLQINFDIKKKKACITIMHKDPISENWYFQYETNKGWRHTKAKKLIDSNSTASKCLQKGEPIFHVCKDLASKNNEYFLSERDISNGVGSVFCYPAFTENPDYMDNYIISIVTYGKRLCDPLDKTQAEAISDIFSDICRRIDLELTLHSIKTWQFEYHTNQSRGGQ
jgi:hypothetical protein